MGTCCTTRDKSATNELAKRVNQDNGLNEI